MEDLNTALLSSYQMSFPNHPNLINPKTTGLWADDLVFVLRTPLLSLKPKLKLMLAILIRTSGDWGLKINFKKSGLMHFFSNMRNYTPFSDKEAVFNDETSSTPLTLTLDSQEKVIIPIVRKYKYLGIFVNNRLNITDHLSFLKKKTDYIINSFLSVRKASQSAKFCFNTWQLFIRPLLDYTNVYLNYVTTKDREATWTMYRQTARRMLFLKPYTSKLNIDSFIQYSYWELPGKYLEIAKLKAHQRLLDDPDFNKLSQKVDFNYRNLDIDKLTPKWISIMNMQFFRGECKFCLNKGSRF